MICSVSPQGTSGQKRKRWSSGRLARTFAGSRAASPRWPRWSWGKGSGGSSELCTSAPRVDPSRSAASPDGEPRSDSGSVWAWVSGCPHPSPRLQTVTVVGERLHSRHNAVIKRGGRKVVQTGVRVCNSTWKLWRPHSTKVSAKYKSLRQIMATLWINCVQIRSQSSFLQTRLVHISTGRASFILLNESWQHYFSGGNVVNGGNLKTQLHTAVQSWWIPQAAFTASWLKFLQNCNRFQLSNLYFPIQIKTGRRLLLYYSNRASCAYPPLQRWVDIQVKQKLHTYITTAMRWFTAPVIYRD